MYNKQILKRTDSNAHSSTRDLLLISVSGNNNHEKCLNFLIYKRLCKSYICLFALWAPVGGAELTMSPFYFS